MGRATGDSSRHGGQIEFLIPRDSVFGADGRADFVGFDGDDDDPFGDEPPGSRWLAALAAVVIVGLLGSGVVAALPWGGDDAAPAPTSAPTTVPAPSSTDRTDPTTSDSTVPTTQRVIDIAAAGPPGYVFDDAGTFQLISASKAADDWVTNQDGLLAFQLWATPDATRTTGRWLALAVTADQGVQALPDARRVVINDRPALLISRPSGVFELAFFALDGTEFQMHGFGFDLAAVTSMAAQVGRGEGTELHLGTLLDGPMTGMEARVVRSLEYPGQALDRISSATRMVSYTDTTRQQFIAIGVLTPTAQDDAVVELMTDPVTDLTADDLAILDRLDRIGAPVRMNITPQWSNGVTASWLTPAGRVVVVSYNVPASTLVPMLPSIRQAQEAEWATLLDASMNGGLSIESNESPRDVPPAIIGVAEQTGRVDPWTMQMSLDASIVSAQDGRSGWAWPLDEVTDIATVRTFSSSTTTFVIATAGWPNEARRVRIALDGQPPVELAMVQLGDTPTFAAGFAYDDLVDGTLEFLALDGEVLTTHQFSP